jgi:hypothetical protein
MENEMDINNSYFNVKSRAHYAELEARIEKALLEARIEKALIDSLLDDEDGRSVPYVLRNIMVDLDNGVDLLVSAMSFNESDIDADLGYRSVYSVFKDAGIFKLYEDYCYHNKIDRKKMIFGSMDQEVYDTVVEKYIVSSFYKYGMAVEKAKEFYPVIVDIAVSLMKTVWNLGDLSGEVEKRDTQAVQENLGISLKDLLQDTLDRYEHLSSIYKNYIERK